MNLACFWSAWCQKLLQEVLFFYFATNILLNQRYETWLVRLSRSWDFSRAHPFIQQTLVKICHIPGLGSALRPRDNWVQPSTFLLMMWKPYLVYGLCLLMMNTWPASSMWSFIIPSSLFCTKPVPRWRSRMDLLGFSSISRCVSTFRRVTRPLEPNLL